eukprot:GHVU01005064.1.p1 GENE.GHVU01005064.1~~GHVU01005064.1.p1  ORF type:complete len:104 (-),score=8.80 GHVU01005064.1:143-454(-)
MSDCIVTLVLLRLSLLSPLLSIIIIPPPLLLSFFLLLLLLLQDVQLFQSQPPSQSAALRDLEDEVRPCTTVDSLTHSYSLTHSLLTHTHSLTHSSGSLSPGGC